MSTPVENPIVELEDSLQDAANKVAERVRRLSDETKDILYFHLRGFAPADIANQVGIADPKSIPDRIEKVLRSFPFSKEIPYGERKAILEYAIDLCDQKTTGQSQPTSSPPAPVPEPKAPKEPAPTPDIQVKGMLIEVPINRIRRFVGQPRTEFDDKELDLLCESIKQVGQLQPGLLRRVHGNEHVDYEIIDGERRWRAAQKAGLTKYSGLEFPGLDIENAKKQYLISVVSNFGRSQHTPLELAHTAQKVMADNDWTVDQVAVAFSKSVGTIRVHLRLLKLVPEVQLLMRLDVEEDKRLNISGAQKLVDFPPAFQRLMAAEIKEKNLSGNKVSWHIRRRAIQEGVCADRSRRGRRPSGDARNLHRAIERFDANVSHYLDLPGTSLSDAFKKRADGERGKTLVLIDDLIEKLQDIKSCVIGEEIKAEAAE